MVGIISLPPTSVSSFTLPVGGPPAVYCVVCLRSFPPSPFCFVISVTEALGPPPLHLVFHGVPSDTLGGPLPFFKKVWLSTTCGAGRHYNRLGLWYIKVGLCPGNARAHLFLFSQPPPPRSTRPPRLHKSPCLGVDETTRQDSSV